jgi:hypothetical protein
MLTQVSKIIPCDHPVDKSGQIKTEAFFTLLELHKVILTTKEKTILQEKFQNGQMIKYLEALSSLRIDRGAALAGEEVWCVPESNQTTEDTPY